MTDGDLIEGLSSDRQGAPIPGFLLPLLLVFEALTLLGAWLTSPFYFFAVIAAVFYVAICFFFPCAVLFAVITVVASPLTLFTNRVQGVVLMMVAICAPLLAEFLGGRLKLTPRAQLPLHSAAICFVSYMVANCAVSIQSGNKWFEASSELVPILEIFACYMLAANLRITNRSAKLLLVVSLLLVTSRAALQLILFADRQFSSLASPLYDASDWDWGSYEFNGVWFIRLIDPVSGLFVALAFAILCAGARGVLRTNAIVVSVVTASVSLLGLMRSQWLASSVCIVATLYMLRTRIRSLIHGLLVFCGVALAVIVVLSLSLQISSLSIRDLLLGRAVDYTRQQVFDPQNSMQMLRLLEIGTAWRAFETSPIFGHGLGSGIGTAIANPRSTIDFTTIHNYYLNLAANAGLVGLGLLAFLGLRIAKSVRSLIKSARSDVERIFVLASVVGLFWYAVLMAFEPFYSTYHIAGLLGILWGVAVSMLGSRIRQEPCHPHESRTGIARGARDPDVARPCNLADLV